MRKAAFLTLLLSTLAFGAQADDRAALQELAPTGKLRVGIGIAQVPSGFSAIRDPASGHLRGVTVELGSALAQKLGVPVDFQVYDSPNAVTNAGASAAWDVSFLAFDVDRAKKVDFGPNYSLFVSRYLVPPGSSIQTIEAVDRAGVRIVAVENSTTFGRLKATLKNATLLSASTADDAVGLLRTGTADVAALTQQSTNRLAPQLVGGRVLDGHAHATGLAVVVPKNRPAALAYVSAFIEEAKASGLVRRAFDNNGLTGVVAPAGSRF